MRLKKLLLPVIFLLFSFSVVAQKISNKFNPVIKGTAAPEIIEYGDGSYLLFGSLSYYDNEVSGELIKVDSKGKRVPTFQKVFTNKPIKKVFVRPDGKILVHGDFTYLNGEPVRNMALLNADGSVDTHFKINQSTYFIKDFVVQSTGKIIVSQGNSATNNIFFNVARLNEDGTADNSFSTNLTLTNFVFLNSDMLDNVFVANRITVFRLDPNGQIDPTFVFSNLTNNSGILKTAVQPDGMLLLSVHRAVPLSPSTPAFQIERYDLTGAKDNSFSSPIADNQISSIFVRKNGNIAVTGYFSAMGGETGNAMQLNQDGSLRTSLITANSYIMRSVYEDSHENLFITGGFTQINDNATFQRSIVKLDTDNQFDATFKVSVSSLRLVTSTGIQKDGRLIVGGSFENVGVGDDTLKLIRINLDGSPDGDFKPVINRTMPNTSVSEMAIQDDNKIIVSGFNLFENASPTFGRLNPDGAFDNTFLVGTGPTSNGDPGGVQQISIHDSKIYVAGLFDMFNGQPKQGFVILDENGLVIGPEKNSLPANSYIQDFEFQSDGKIIFLGTFPGLNRNFLRLNTDGSIDETFTLSIEGNCSDVAIDLNGQILVTGGVLNHVQGSSLLRFNSDGSPDNTLDFVTLFESVSDFTQIKVLENNEYLITGRFSGYNGQSSPGVVILSNDGEIIPFENDLDIGSIPYTVAFSHNNLYVLGILNRNKWSDPTGAIKIVFPIPNSITEFEANAISDSEIQLNWQGSFPGAEQIRIEQSHMDITNYEEASLITPGGNQYVASDLSDATTYYYRLTGVNEFYTSQSFEQKDTTFIKQQISLPATDATDVSFQANWIYEPGTDSCQIQVSKDHFVTFVSGYENLVVKSGSLLLEGLEKNTTYQYRVRRYKNGISSDYSETVEVQIIVGVDDETRTILLFPNPAKDYILIQQSVPIKAVTIYAPDGSIARIFRLDSDIAHLDVGDLPAGVFVVAVTSANNRVSKFRISKAN